MDLDLDLDLNFENLTTSLRQTRYMSDGGSVSSYDSHFANISSRHEISTLKYVNKIRPLQHVEPMSMHAC